MDEDVRAPSEPDAGRVTLGRSDKLPSLDGETSGEEVANALCVALPAPPSLAAELEG